jgi:hypothetical protein
LRRFFVLCLLSFFAVTSLCAQTFRNPRLIPTPLDPLYVHVADLNNDGLPDIYYATEFSGDSEVTPTVHILLAKPDGSYVAQPAPVWPANTSMAYCGFADINGDHNIDLACEGTSGGQVALVTLFGNGDGTFQSPVTQLMPSSFNSGYEPAIFEIAAAADFNGDGHIDLYLTNGYVLLGDGTGHFTALNSSNIFGGSVSTFVGQVTVADVNGDGKLDILYPNGAGVALGNGDGTFGYMTLYAPTTNHCVFQDMDGDGHLDAVCGELESTNGDSNGFSELLVLHGNSDGSFATTPIATQTYGAQNSPNGGIGQYPTPLAVQDINHDGIPDVIVSSEDGYGVILGQPSLQFAAPVYYPAGYTSESIYSPTAIVADMNNDGSPDLVAPGPNGILITYGQSDGTFDSASVFLSGQAVSYATVADFNGDGIPDVATSGGYGVNFRFGKGDGTFGPVTNLPNSQFYVPLQIFHGDFNGDGNQDILTSGTTTANNPATEQTYIMFGHGNGTFDAPVPATVSQSTSVLPPNPNGVADVNQDGRDDVILSDGSDLEVVLAESNGSLGPSSVNSPIPQDQTYQYGALFAIGDFNNDGKPDAIVGLQHLYFLAGNGDGSFNAAGTGNTIPAISGNLLNAVATGDFDGDGNLDAAVLERTTTGGSTAYVYYGNGDGTFSAPVIAGTFDRAYTSLNAADVNGDGRADLILSYTDTGSNLTLDGIYGIGVVDSEANRTFGSEINYTGGIGLSSPTAADFNRDGFPDLLFANLGNAYTVLMNSPGPVVSRQLVAQPEPSIVNQPFNLVATLTPPSGSSEKQLSGTVTFSVDGVQAGTASLANNIATLSITSSLSLGTHRITASWPGDSTYPSLTIQATHAVIKSPVNITAASVQPSPATVGQKVTVSFSLANSINSSSMPLTGTYTVLDGTDIVGSGTIATGTGSYSVTGLYPTAGTHTYTVNYSGDSQHASATSILSLVVSPAQSAITLQSTPNPVVYPNSITFTAQVKASVDPATPASAVSGEGTLTISGLPNTMVTQPVEFVASTQPNSPVTVTATAEGRFTPGTYNISASFSGDANLLSSTSAVIKQVISPPASQSYLSVTPSPGYLGHNVTLTAYVRGPLSTPTGVVQFLDGATVLGSGTLVSGSATFSTSSLAIGAHTLSVSYAGDADNGSSSSLPYTETIEAYDFSVTATPASASVAMGGSTTVSITETSVGGFAEATNFMVSGAPADLTVSWSPNSLTPAAGGTATATLTIQANAGTSAKRGSGQDLFDRSRVVIAFTFIPILLPAFRRRRGSSLLGLVLLGVLFAGICGCGGGGNSQISPPQPHTYTLQITATSAQSQLSHSLTLPLTVTN